ncbi:hypothetical protein OIU76_009365 [Salix suchowensis]|nr:hypothetical protein OIU76_009365 [Salix suchowensis]
MLAAIVSSSSFGPVLSGVVGLPKGHLGAEGAHLCPMVPTSPLGFYELSLGSSSCVLVLDPIVVHWLGPLDYLGWFLQCI